MTIEFSPRPTRMKLRRSTLRRPCPKCGKIGCGQSEALTLCWRTESERQAKSGAYIHFADGQESAPVPARVEPLRASIERRHQVYSALLEILPLHGYHADHLTEVRRLSEETIARCQFASVPRREDGDWIAQRFAKHSELRGIPGFWKRYERWVMAFSGCAGFFIPIRNLAGQIEALQIRRDNGTPKYLLFSSTDRPDGCNSGAPVHFAGVSRAARSVIVTEGALKAEIIAEHLRCPVLGLVGVGTFPDSFGIQLRRELPALRQVLVAFDQPEFETSDRARTNVAQQLARLHDSLRRVGLQSETLRWEGAKALDDYLIGQEVAA